MGVAGGGRGCPGQVQWSGVIVSCPSGGLCGERECGVLLEGGSGCELGFGEDARAEVASVFGPFVGLFGQDGSDEADDGLAVGEDAHGVGAAPGAPTRTPGLPREGSPAGGGFGPIPALIAAPSPGDRIAIHVVTGGRRWDPLTACTDAVTLRAGGHRGPRR